MLVLTFPTQCEIVQHPWKGWSGYPPNTAVLSFYKTLLEISSITIFIQPLKCGSATVSLSLWPNRCRTAEQEQQTRTWNKKGTFFPKSKTNSLWKAWNLFDLIQTSEVCDAFTQLQNTLWLHGLNFKLFGVLSQ